MANTQRLFVCSRTADETLTDWQRERRDGPLQPFPGNRTIRGFYVPWWAWGTLFLLAALLTELFR